MSGVLKFGRDHLGFFLFVWSGDYSLRPGLLVLRRVHSALAPARATLIRRKALQQGSGIGPSCTRTQIALKSLGENLSDIERLDRKELCSGR